MCFFVDMPYFARANEGPWWSVDLLTKIQIHLIRIITDVGYKPKDFKGLYVLVGKTLKYLSSTNSLQRIQACAFSVTNMNYYTQNM